jgi:hypothetical protein
MKIKFTARLAQLNEYINITGKGVTDRTPLVLELTEDGIKAKAFNQTRSYVRHTSDELSFPDIAETFDTVEAIGDDKKRILLPLPSLDKLLKSMKIANALEVDDIVLDITYSKSQVKIGKDITDVAEYHVATKMIIVYGTIKQAIAMADTVLVYYIEDMKFSKRLNTESHGFVMELMPDHVSVLSSLLDMNKVETDEAMNGTIELRIPEPKTEDAKKVINFRTRNKSNAMYTFEGNVTFVNDVTGEFLLPKRNFVGMIKGTDSIVEVYFMAGYWLTKQANTTIGDIYLINALVKK